MRRRHHTFHLSVFTHLPSPLALLYLYIIKECSVVTALFGVLSQGGLRLGNGYLKWCLVDL